MKMNKAIWGPSLLVLAIAVVTSSTVQAASYSMTGKWNESRGTIDLPLGAVLGAPGPPVLGAGTAMQTGAAVPGGGPATITIPAGVFTDPALVRGFIIPVPNIIQLITTIAHSGPTVATTLMAGAGPGSFAYCPGAAANPTCTTHVAGGAQGVYNGIVQYTAGPNTFGGTFRMLLTGTGQLVNKGDPLPPTVMTTMGGTIPAEAFSALNVAIGGSGLAVNGGSFAQMQTLTFPALPATHPLGYMTTAMGLLTPGPVVGSGLSSNQTATGFPFTTGTVFAYRTLNNQGAAQLSKHTFTGYDNRDAAGNGRIQLVSGGMSRTFPTDGSDPPEGSAMARATLQMTFLRTPALPVSSPAALMTLGSLVMLSAGYAVTSKRARK